VTRGEERAKHIAQVERAVRAIEREKMAWADPLAALLRAGVATVRGHAETAIRLYDEAALNFDAADMALYAALARKRA
jgi:hypothetical protein